MQLPYAKFIKFGQFHNKLWIFIWLDWFRVNCLLKCANETKNENERWFQQKNLKNKDHTLLFPLEGKIEGLTRSSILLQWERNSEFR